MIELSDRDKVMLSYIRDNRGNPGLGDEIERPAEVTVAASLKTSLKF